MLRGITDIQWNIGVQEEKCKVDVYGKGFSLHVILHGALNKNKSNKARNKQTTKDKNKQKEYVNSIISGKRDLKERNIFRKFLNFTTI